MPTITAKLTLVRSAAAIACAALLGVPAVVSAATGVMPVGFVAVTNGSGSLQISQYGLDGTVVRRLTTGPANHNYPSVSPDGRRMVFTGDEGGDSEIYSRELGTAAVAVQLTHPPLQAFSPSWSPRGDAIVYSALAPGDAAYQIFVARADGTHPVRLTSSVDSGNTQPVFSPDGRRIAFLNGRKGGVDRIWVMNVDGAGAVPLSAGPRDAYPAWLDAQNVLFAREDLARGTARIMSVGLDGRERNASPATQHFIEPRPLPDGRAYGATVEEDGGLHLVRISRTDGAPLMAAAPSDFVVVRLPVSQREGSLFTLAWILAAPAPGTGPPLVVYSLAAAGLLLIAGFGVMAWRKTSAC